MNFFNISLSESTVFFIVLFLILTSFLSCLLLLIFSKANIKKLKMLYIILSLITTILSIFLVDKNMETIGYIKCISCSLILALICFIPLYLINFRTIKVNKKEKQLIDKIDEKINNENTVNKIMSELLKNNVDGKTENPIKKPVKEKLILEESEIKQEDELDFAHVKNVLKRVIGYNLNTTEKREIRELESNLLESELNGVSKELKLKINDGLNSLLKIMAKYSN